MNDRHRGGERNNNTTDKPGATPFTHLTPCSYCAVDNALLEKTPSLCDSKVRTPNRTMEVVKLDRSDPH